MRPRTALLVIAFLAFVSLGLPDGVLGVAWPSVRDSFGRPVSSLGVLIASTVVGYLVSSFCSGQVVRAVGVGGLLLWSSVVIVVSLAGFAAAPWWGAMLACGVLAGLGAGAIDAGINAYAAHHFSPRVVNWLHACYGVGATLGPLLMTAVLTGGWSWRWGYSILGTAIAGMAVCFLFTLELWDDAAPAEAGPGGAGDEARDAGPGPSMADALRRPAWGGIAFFFLYVGLEVTAGQWAYSLFTESRGVPKGVAGIWVGVFWGSLTAGRILFGAAAARVPPGRLLAVALVGAPLAAALVWWDVGGVTDGVGLGLLGFCLAPIYPLMTSLTPGRVGRAFAAHQIGFQVSAGYLGAAALPGLTGLVARWRGLEVVGPVLCGGAIALLALYLAIRSKGVAVGDPVAPAQPAARRTADEAPVA